MKYCRGHLTQIRNGMVVVLGGDHEELCLMGAVFYLQDEKSTELDVGDGHTTMYFLFFFCHWAI